MFGDIWHAALIWLLMKGWPWQSAVHEAYKLAIEGAEIMQRYGVDVSAGRPIVETGAVPDYSHGLVGQAQQFFPPAAPQGQYQPPPYQPLARPPPPPNPPPVMTVPGQAPQVLQQPPAHSQAHLAVVPPAPVAPVVALAPAPQANPEIAAFMAENFKPQQWAAEGDVDAASRFAKELHSRFGIGVG